MHGAIGQIANVRLADRVPPGRDRVGMRPSVTCGDPSPTGPTRFDVVILVPLTTHRGASWQAANPTAYPVLVAGSGGIRVDSVALVDQVQVVDSSRVVSVVGQLSAVGYGPIDTALRLTMGLPREVTNDP